MKSWIVMLALVLGVSALCIGCSGGGEDDAKAPPKTTSNTDKAPTGPKDPGTATPVQPE